MPRILIYGDSNSFGTAATASLQDDPVLPRGARWGDVLGRELGDGFDIVIEGLPGRTSVHDDPIEGAYRNGLRPLRAILESHKPIDLLIICLGTNDAKHRFGLTPIDIALGVARLTREAMALGIVGRALVVCPPPVKETGDLGAIFEGAEARCVGLPDLMARFAGETGADFFDAGQVISVDPVDGVHWDSDAHAALAEALAPKVREVLQ